VGELKRLRAQCGNGVNCPSIDRRAEGGLVVTGERIDNPDLPAHEASVLVPDTLLPEVASLDIPDLASYLSQRHTADLFRLETLDWYDVSSDDDDYYRYVSGAPAPEASVKDRWLDQLRADRAAGRQWRRVHALRSPLNDYLRYECEWCYTYNVAAGEDVRILDVTEAPAGAALLGVGDFFAVDGEHVVRSRYNTGGRFLSAVAVGTADRGAYVALAELAWQMGTPFAAWWAAHPEYHRATPAA